MSDAPVPAALPCYLPCYGCQASMPLDFTVCGSCGSGLDPEERRMAVGLPADPVLARLAYALGAVPPLRLCVALEGMDLAALGVLIDMVEDATGAREWTGPQDREAAPDADVIPLRTDDPG